MVVTFSCLTVGMPGRACFDLLRSCALSIGSVFSLSFCWDSCIGVNDRYNAFITSCFWECLTKHFGDHFCSCWRQVQDSFIFFYLSLFHFNRRRIWGKEACGCDSWRKLGGLRGSWDRLAGSISRWEVNGVGESFALLEIDMEAAVDVRFGLPRMLAIARQSGATLEAWQHLIWGKWRSLSLPAFLQKDGGDDLREAKDEKLFSGEQLFTWYMFKRNDSS